MAKNESRKFEVEFGTVSFGKETARLGIRFARGEMTLNQAVDLLCGARLRLDMRVTDGNNPLLPDALPNLKSIADSKHLGVTMRDFTVGLAFSRAEIDANTLCNFANSKGVVKADRIGNIEPAVADADDAADAKPDEE